MALAIGGGITFGGGISISPEAGAPTDPFFSDVTLLLHGDGTNGSQTFVDSSLAAQTPTVNGDTQINTSIKKFGTGSINFDGTGDFLTYSNTATNTLDSEDFTIEGWFYKTADTVGSGAQNIIWWNGNPSSNSQAAVRVLVNNNETMALLVSESGSAWQINTTTASAIVTLNTWTHFAVVRSGATVTLYVGGTSRLSGSLTSSGASLYSGSLNYIGNMLFSSGSHFWIGNLDDIRITKGVARYTENFTPPTEAFPDQ